jgi:hypothetical protein
VDHLTGGKPMTTSLDPAIRSARTQLEAGIAQLEKDALGSRYNTFSIRALGCAAVLLGQNDIADRAVRLLRVTPDQAFWAGAITNIELPMTVPVGMRTIDTLESLQKQHPPFRAEDIVERIRANANDDEHLALCLEGRFQEARAKATSGLKLEEVGDTLAVLGGFDAAVSISRNPALDDFRQRGVRFVLVIELFRRGRIAESGAILAELESAGLQAGERVHLALGFAGREPWSGYPYPDW